MRQLADSDTTDNSNNNHQLTTAVSPVSTSPGPEAGKFISGSQCRRLLATQYAHPRRRYHVQPNKVDPPASQSKCREQVGWGISLLVATSTPLASQKNSPRSHSTNPLCCAVEAVDGQDWRSPCLGKLLVYWRDTLIFHRYLFQLRQPLFFDSVLKRVSVQ